MLVKGATGDWVFKIILRADLRQGITYMNDGSGFCITRVDTSKATTIHTRLGCRPNDKLMTYFPNKLWWITTDISIFHMIWNKVLWDSKYEVWHWTISKRLFDGKNDRKTWWVIYLNIYACTHSHWASSTGLTAVSKCKPRLPAQWAVGTHRKGPSRRE